MGDMEQRIPVLGRLNSARRPRIDADVRARAETVREHVGHARTVSKARLEQGVGAARATWGRRRRTLDITRRRAVQKVRSMRLTDIG